MVHRATTSLFDPSQTNCDIGCHARTQAKALDSVPYYGVYTWHVMQQVKVKPLTIAPLAHEADINLETVRYYEARVCRPSRRVPRRLVACSLPKLHAASDSSSAPWIWDFFLAAQRNPRDLRCRRFAHDLIQECNCVPGQELDVELALREALANAVLHCNRQDPEKRIHISCWIHFGGEVSILVKDEGKGFDPTKIPDPTTIDNLESPHGRGIYLMRALMDEVHFEHGGAEVHMRKGATRGGRDRH